jgi:hypothetical protein
MHDPSGDSRWRHGVWPLVVVVALGVVAQHAFVVVRDLATSRKGRSIVREASLRTGARPDRDFEIPPGTGRRLLRGETVDVLPSPLVVEVGDRIRIRNRDDAGHVLGPFVVGPHETLVERFTRPGRLTGACRVHSSGRLVVEVRAARPRGRSR